MPIEEDIRKAIEKVSFNKKLLEKFIDMSKYLEGRLKEGEDLFPGLKLSGSALGAANFIYLELHNKEGEPRRVVTLDCLGDITYSDDLFKDYRPSPESQRE